MLSESLCRWELNIESARIIFSSVKDGFTHAIYIFLSLVLTCSYVDVCYHLFPSCFHIQLWHLFLAFCFLTDVLSCSFSLLHLLATQKLLELFATVLLSFAFLFPLFLLSYYISTLFYRNLFWIRSSSSRIRLVISSSSKSLKSFSGASSALKAVLCSLAE